MSLCEIIRCRIKTFGWKQKLGSLNSCLMNTRETEIKAESPGIKARASDLNYQCLSH